MKFNCIRCGKSICKLDLRKSKNKEEDVLFCKGCLSENLGFSRKLFAGK